MPFVKPTLLSGLVALTLNFNVVALDSSARQNVYEPAYFTAFAPRTARDMVGRIPGFQISSGDNKRGLGQGGANVLINGERISGKTSPFEQLGRIPAGSVIRIEILDGTSLDIPGLSGDVANITTKTIGVNGTFEWRPEWRPGLEANLLNGNATISGEWGKLSYSAKLENSAFRNGNRGPEKLIAADGTVFETRYEDGQYYGDNPKGSLDIVWTPKPDHIGNLNMQYSGTNFNERVLSNQQAVTARGRARAGLSACSTGNSPLMGRGRISRRLDQPRRLHPG